HGKVIIDHVEEHTVGLVQDAGYWAGMTLYPESKCTPNRAIDMLETYDSSRLWLNSACDWGVSDPMAVVKCGFEMKKRKHSAEEIERILFENPKRFLSQSKNFRI
ncbi:MAG: hydrolase, TatD family, partial [Akkermansiaceae bacterium]|nr:hydrolase, TatD family [Akkermansiaceae bacterium]